MAKISTIKKVINENLTEAKIGSGTSISFKDFESTSGKEDKKGATAALADLGIKAGDAAVLMSWDEKTPWPKLTKTLKDKGIKFKQSNLASGNIAVLNKKDLGKL